MGVVFAASAGGVALFFGAAFATGAVFSFIAGLAAGAGCAALFACGADAAALSTAGLAVGAGFGLAVVVEGVVYCAKRPVAVNASTRANAIFFMFLKLCCG